jgi:FkbM family methyltransferase
VLKTYSLERVITIECNPECIEICRKNFAPYPNITLVEVAAWHTEGKIPFYRVTESHDWNGKPTHNIGASSCFQTNDTWPFEKYQQEKIEVPARRLDGVLKELKIGSVDLICMDAQGAELYALQGLGDYLKDVQAIITELELKPMYHKQTLFEDVQRYLLKFGFRLVAEHRWAETAGDFLFVRESAPRVSSTASSTQAIARVSLAVLDRTTPILPPSPAAFTRDDALLACRVAQQQLGAGCIKAAETIVKAVLEQVPTCEAPFVVIGQMAENTRDFRSAIAAYERASELNPGQAMAFTRRALLKLRLEIGDPPAAKPTDRNRPFVTMSDLGTKGRFGNQLLQYGLIRLYAARLGAQALFPDWIGRDLFGHDDGLPFGLRPTAAIDDAVVTNVLAGRTTQTRPNVDVSGYFCGDVRDWAKGKAEFQRMFEPALKVRHHADAALRRVMKSGRTLVALHLRRGDYGQGPFWIAPAEWYKQWLAQVWPGLDAPVLYLATDEPQIAEQFREFKPITAEQLGKPLPGVEFFTDHWVMRHADLLATSNSTFSGTAALLNRKPVRCVRPDRAINGLREFNPWAEKVLLD